MGAANTPTFGMLLRRYRRAAGLTQEELAGRASLSPEGISALERGVNRAPRKDTVELLVEALALPERDRMALESAARRRFDSLGPRAEAHASSSGVGGMLPPLIGRTRELAAIDRQVAAVGPPALLFAGEPGVGKTRLLREAEQRAMDAGWSVLAGGCQRQSGQMPYAPLLGALQHHLQGRPPGQRITDLDGCAWLVRLLPELTELITAPSWSWPLPPEQERRLTFAAVSRYLKNVAGPAGTLLVLDDIQWSDTDALELLAVLVRGADRPSQRIVGAYCETELEPDHPFALALADLARDGLIEHCRLDSLAADEARALAATVVRSGWAERIGSASVIERTVHRTGGIPFFIVSCMHALRAGAIAEVPADDIPWDVAQCIRQRIAALPQPARDLLDLVAVGGPRTPLWLLLAAGGGDEDERAGERVARALGAACRARLLAEDGEGGYQFAHELIGDVIASDLGSARRASLHGQIARLLERGGGDVAAEQLAYHYARSGIVEKAVTWLERAGDRAERMGAHAAAEGYYRDLVGRLDALHRVIAAASARRKLGTVVRALAHYREALDVFEEAAGTYRRMDDEEAEGQVTALIGQAYADYGMGQEGIVRLLRLLESPEAQRLTPGTHALLYDTLAQLYHIGGDYTQQLASSGRAEELAQAAQDQRLLAQIRMRTGNALRMLGRLSEASAMIEEAIASAQAAGDQLTLAYALDNVSVVYLLRGEFDRASRYVGRALALVEDSGDLLTLQLMVLRRGLNAFATGDWVQSRRDFERATALMEQAGTSWVSAYITLGLGQLELAQGERTRALTHLEEAIALARRTGDLQALRWAQSALAEAELLDEHAQAARERLEPLLDRPGQQEGLVTYLMPYLAWAYLELGDEQRAEAVVAECIARATSEDIRLALVDAMRARALLALRRGHWEAAEDAMQRALALVKTMDYPYGTAKVLYTCGLFETARGDQARARDYHEAALAILRPRGERLYAARCEQAIGLVE